MGIFSAKLEDYRLRRDIGLQEKFACDLYDIRKFKRTTKAAGPSWNSHGGPQYSWRTINAFGDEGHAMRAVLDLQGVPYAINDLRLRVDCEFYSDFDQLLALARVANDRTLKTNLIAEFNGQMRPVLFSSGPIGLKCRYYPNELKMREDELRGAHYFVDVSLQTDESITDARKKLLRAGIPHHVEGNQIWIPCEIYQSIRIFDEVQGLRAGYGKVDEDSYTQISDLKLLFNQPGLVRYRSEGPLGLECHAYNVRHSEKNANVLVFESDVVGNSNFKYDLGAVLSSRNIAHEYELQIPILHLWVPCEIYQDFDFLIEVSEIANDPEQVKALKKNSEIQKRVNPSLWDLFIRFIFGT